MNLSITKLRNNAKKEKIPLYTRMSKSQLESILSNEKYSLGWRWKYIKPNILKKEERDVMKLLLSPVRKLPNDIIDYVKKHKVYITMTTSPLRLKRILAVLATLDLTYVDCINIVLPEEYGRNKEKYNTQDIKIVSKFPKVKIIRTKKDYGPITKMLPTLKSIKDSKSIVISIDDDVGYPMGMINELIYQKVKIYPKYIVATTEGMNLYDNIDLKDRWPSRKIPRKPFADLVEGWMGVVYTKKLVNDNELKEMEKITRVSKECLLSDDLVISYVLAKHKIHIVKLDNEYAGFPISYLYGTGDDALMRGGGTGKVVDVEELSDEYNLKKYDRCLNDIKNKNVI